MSTCLARAAISSIRVIFNGDQDDTQEKRKKLDEKLKRLKEKVKSAEEALKQAVAGGDPQKLSSARKALETAQRKLKDEQPDKDNVVTAVLSYPRSGESQVVCMRPLDLPPNLPVVFPQDDFFQSVLFKEEIQGETLLQIKVIDKDKKSGFWLFIRGVLSAVFGAITKGVIGDISEVFVSKTAAGISKKIEDAIKGSDKERVTIIAESAKVPITVSAAGELEFPSAADMSDASGPIRYDKQNRQLILNLVAPQRLVLAERRSPAGNIIQEVIPEGENNGQIILRFLP